MREVTGSSPVVPTIRAHRAKTSSSEVFYGGIAQLVERLNGIQEVTCSTHAISTTERTASPFFFCGGDSVREKTRTCSPHAQLLFVLRSMARARSAKYSRSTTQGRHRRSFFVAEIAFGRKRVRVRPMRGFYLCYEAWHERVARSTHAHHQIKIIRTNKGKCNPRLVRIYFVFQGMSIEMGYR